MEYCLNLCDIFTALLREYECVENLISSAERTKKQDMEGFTLARISAILILFRISEIFWQTYIHTV